MADSIGDLLLKKADNLDTGRGDDLKLIQLELNRLFGDGVARAREITKRDELVICAKSPSQITTIRYAHEQIMAAIRNQTDRKIIRLIFRIAD
ncbi:DUF721 domain-containing protein [Candidatus Saccharibacteria bacterium]|nr:DUF721 domain-containing protein [Candidatus Saccharibacteria bacterium]